jgi:hypothetical protein
MAMPTAAWEQFEHDCLRICEELGDQYNDQDFGIHPQSNRQTYLAKQVLDDPKFIDSITPSKAPFAMLILLLRMPSFMK